jgi:hypothetical protein
MATSQEPKFIITVNGIFLGNTYDPLELSVKWPASYMNVGESEFASRARTVKWLDTKTIGPPMATPENEESDLRAYGMIGVYFNEKNGDTYCSAEEVSASFPGGLTDVEYLGGTIYRMFEERHKDD